MTDSPCTVMLSEAKHPVNNGLFVSLRVTVYARSNSSSLSNQKNLSFSIVVVEVGGGRVISLVFTMVVVRNLISFTGMSE